jgi:hypothetical protein
LALVGLFAQLPLASPPYYRAHLLAPIWLLLYLSYLSYLSYRVRPVSYLRYGRKPRKVRRRRATAVKMGQNEPKTVRHEPKLKLFK